MNRNTTLREQRRRSRRRPHGDPSQLTTKQRHTLEFIWDRVIATGEAPTVREICEDASVSSPQAGYHRLVALEEYGLIRIEPEVWRGIRVLVWPPKGWTRTARNVA